MGAGFGKVQDVLENYKSATYEKNVDKFISAYASDVHIFDSWNKWESRGIEEWSGMVRQWFDGLNEDGILLKTDFNDVAIEENSGLAFVHCAVTFSAHNASGEIVHQVTNRFTFGLRQDDESWSIVHEHSSLPINMETGKGIFN